METKKEMKNTETTKENVAPEKKTATGLSKTAQKKLEAMTCIGKIKNEAGNKEDCNTSLHYGNVSYETISVGRRPYIRCTCNKCGQKYEIRPEIKHGANVKFDKPIPVKEFTKATKEMTWKERAQETIELMKKTASDMYDRILTAAYAREDREKEFEIKKEELLKIANEKRKEAAIKKREAKAVKKDLTNRSILHTKVPAYLTIVPNGESKADRLKREDAIVQYQKMIDATHKREAELEKKYLAKIAATIQVNEERAKHNAEMHAIKMGRKSRQKREEVPAWTLKRTTKEERITKKKAEKAAGKKAFEESGMIPNAKTINRRRKRTEISTEEKAAVIAKVQLDRSERKFKNKIDTRKQQQAAINQFLKAQEIRNAKKADTKLKYGHVPVLTVAEKPIDKKEESKLMDFSVHYYGSEKKAEGGMKQTFLHNEHIRALPNAIKDIANTLFEKTTKTNKNVNKMIVYYASTAGDIIEDTKAVYARAKKAA